MEATDIIPIDGLKSHASPQALEARGITTITLSAAQKAALKSRGAYSLYIIGYAKPLPTCLGDLDGIRPFLVGGSASFETTYLAQLNRLSPVVPAVLFLRRWFHSKAEARSFEFEMPKLLAKYASKERGDWLALREGADTVLLELEVDDLAQKLGFEILDDDALVKLLDAEIAKSGNVAEED